MTFEYIYFTGVAGDRFDFNTDISPLHSFSMEVDLRSQDREKSQKHGIYQNNTYLGKRVFHLEGDLFGSVSADVLALRRSLLRSILPKSQRDSTNTGILTMRVTGMDEDVKAVCTIDGYPELPVEALSPSVAHYQVNLKSFDPRLYGGNLYSATAFGPSPSNNIGRLYNKTYNKTYVPVDPTGDIIVTNSGDIETYPIITFYGPCTGPRVILVRPGELDLVVSLDNLVLSDTSDSVTLDFGAGTAVIDSGGNVYSYKSGTWWALEPGDNQVRFTAFSIGVGCKAVITWYNAYML